MQRVPRASGLVCWSLVRLGHGHVDRGGEGLLDHFLDKLWDPRRDVSLPSGNDSLSPFRVQDIHGNGGHDERGWSAASVSAGISGSLRPRIRLTTAALASSVV